VPLTIRIVAAGAVFLLAMYLMRSGPVLIRTYS
jgi:hypothetical protein